MNKLGFSLVIMVFFGLASGHAWAEGAAAADLSDPPTASGFSAWLWWVLVLSGLFGLGVFYFMHKRFLARDRIVPYPASILMAGLLLLGPVYFDSSIYGGFSRDCFEDYIVSGDRVLAKGELAYNCAEARENVGALGIGFVIRHYKDSVLESNYLTTVEIEVFYTVMLTLWTLLLTYLLLYGYKIKIIK